MKKAREKIQCGFIRKILLNIQCQPSDENAEKTVEALDIYHRHFGYNNLIEHPKYDLTLENQNL